MLLHYGKNSIKCRKKINNHPSIHFPDSLKTELRVKGVRWSLSQQALSRFTQTFLMTSICSSLHSGLFFFALTKNSITFCSSWSVASKQHTKMRVMWKSISNKTNLSHMHFLVEMSQNFVHWLIEKATCKLVNHKRKTGITWHVSKKATQALSRRCKLWAACSNVVNNM